MTDNEIQFEEEYGDSRFHIRSRKLLGEPTTPTMVNFLLDKKIAKNEKQALYILGSIITIFLVVSGIIINKSLINDEPLVIVNKYGQEIPFEVYVDMISRGVDPVL